MSMIFRFSATLKNRIAVAALMVAVSLVASAGKAQAQGATPAPEKKERKAKDQAEEDLLSAVKKEQDSNKKIALLKQWKEK